MNHARSHLVVALDLPGRMAALQAVDRLSGHAGCFKLGLEVFVREGPRLVEEIRGRGERIFLDLKLHDIPNTVAGAVRSACKLGVQMITLHAAGGKEMLEAAADAAGAAVEPPLLLAVTALTSLRPEALESIGIGSSVSEWVEKLAALARQSGIHGLVASAWELSSLRRKFGGDFQYAVPGIRLAGAATHDQGRVAQPAQAMLAGADFLVVGRPILQAPDPVRAADLIVGDIESALHQLASSTKS